MPMDILFGLPEESKTSIDSYLSKLVQYLEVIHEDVRQKVKVESDPLKTRYDAGGRSSNPSRRKEKLPKLQRSWKGPYVVIKRLNDVVYRIHQKDLGRK